MCVCVCITITSRLTLSASFWTSHHMSCHMTQQRMKERSEVIFRAAAKRETYLYSRFFGRFRWSLLVGPLGSCTGRKKIKKHTHTANQPLTRSWYTHLQMSTLVNAGRRVYRNIYIYIERERERERAREREREREREDEIKAPLFQTYQAPHSDTSVGPVEQETSLVTHAHTYRGVF